MLYIYPETVESVRKFVNKKWPDKNKEVYCQENESAWHQNRYILITVSPRINFKVVHYEYINGYLELHLEDDYYGNTFNQRLYKYLRDNIDTESGDYLWHNWNGMKQGRLRYEYKIGDLLELADYLTKFISKIDPLIEDFLNTYYDGNNDTQKEIFTVSSIDFNKIEDGASVNINITDGTGSKVVLHTMSLKDVLSLKLKIPDYQRIYCWPQKNVEQLLDDIFIPRNHKYHLGTLILQKKGDDYVLNSLEIVFPKTIAEQRAIAEALSDIDGLIAALDKKIAKKRLIKQGAMQQLLTGKKRLPGFTDSWVEKKLGEILDYEQPQPYLVVSTDYVDSGIPVLTAGKSRILGYTTEQFGIYNKLPVIIFDDFTTDSKYISYPFKVKSSAMKVLSLKNNDYDLRLVYELMQQIDFPLKDHQRYWISEYSQLTISIPKDREEQTAIATILTDMDKEIADLEAKRDKYSLLKSGMMQKLLTGQIRLKINRI